MFTLTLSAIELQLFKCLVIEVILLPLANLRRGLTQAVWIRGTALILHEGQSLSNQESAEEAWALGPPCSQGRSSPSWVKQPSLWRELSDLLPTALDEKAL